MQSKTKIIGSIILVVIIIAVSVFAYFWLSDVNNKKIQAEASLDKVRKYEELSKKIQDEKQRCQQFISQESGQFGEFEYCQKFIEWQEQN